MTNAISKHSSYDVSTSTMMANIRVRCSIHTADTHRHSSILAFEDVEIRTCYAYITIYLHVTECGVAEGPWPLQHLAPHRESRARPDSLHYLGDLSPLSHVFAESAVPHVPPWPEKRLLKGSRFGCSSLSGALGRRSALGPIATCMS